MGNHITFKRINQLAIPATIAGIAEPILSITDTAIVGNIPVNGTESLAAVGIVGSFLSMLIWILGQTRSAISALVSQYLGANRLEEIKTLPAQAIFLNLSLSFLVLFATIFIIEDIFTLLNASGKILEYCVSYYSIRVWGFPLTLFTFAVMGIFRGLQNTFWPMVIAITGALLNILLDFLLVYGVTDLIPPLHLEGAAWASLIAQGAMALMALVLLIRKTHISLKVVAPIHPELHRLIGMSLNLFVRTLALNAALLLAIREATALGNAQIGAHTVAINLWLFAAFFIDGYSGAGNILGGRLLGAKDFNGLWSMAKKVLINAQLMALAIMALSLLFFGPIGRLFSKDMEVLTTFYSIFPIVILGLPINTLAFVFDGIFKGMGEMKFLRNVLLAATIVGFVPTLYLSKHMGWGLHGIWAAFVVWMLFRGVPLVLRFRKKFKPLVQNP
ncbi:MAG: MATE family efflux transporter [Flavobacteriaceae bacterium]